MILRQCEHHVKWRPNSDASLMEQPLVQSWGIQFLSRLAQEATWTAPRNYIFPPPPAPVVIIAPSLFRLSDAWFIVIGGVPSGRFAFAGAAPAGEFFAHAAGTT